jgi:hypothetical protein
MFLEATSEVQDYLAHITIEEIWGICKLDDYHRSWSKKYYKSLTDDLRRHN